MDGANSILALNAAVDGIGTRFTGATYGALSSYMMPVMSGVFALYLIFWGFQFWQGRGDGNVVTMAFRLLRVAIIFFIATSWGPFQVGIYQLVTNAPIMVNSVMLNNVVNPDNGKAMKLGTPASDLSQIYGFALRASLKIEEEAANAAAVSPPADGSRPPPSESLKKPVKPKDPNNPLSVVLTSSVQAAIVWIAAALFVGFAICLMLFAKIGLWVMLALAPIFIIMLMFQIPSRFFSGWLSATIQVMLIPIFLSTFLSFYILGIRSIVFALVQVLNNGDSPTMKEVGPFVLVCFSGLFLLAQIVPLAARIASSTQEWATTALGSAGNGRLRSGTMAVGRGVAVSAHGSAAPSGSQLGGANPSETALREIQDRNAAVKRQSRNR